MKTKNKTILDFTLLAPFDRYEGDRRTDIKSYDRALEYRGYTILRNGYIPNGANGRWEIPNLKYIGIGGVKTGFLTVSILQSQEAIDRWFNMNEELKKEYIVEYE